MRFVKVEVDKLFRCARMQILETHGAVKGECGEADRERRGPFRKNRDSKEKG